MTTSLISIDSRNPNKCFIVEAHRDDNGAWVIDGAFVGGRDSRQPYSIPPDDMPRVIDFLNGQEGVDARNQETSRAEVEAFKAGAAQNVKSYTSYYFEAKNGQPAYIGTWMGDKLGEIVWQGSEYKTPSFGGWPNKRVNFRMRGIDGKLYSGTYYSSSGDYVRFRMIKG